MPYRPTSPLATLPNGMIATVAIAVNTEIAGASAIIQATPAGRVELLLRQQLEHVGERLERALVADAVGAVARLEAAEPLALEQHHHRRDLEDDDQDHDRLEDLDPPVLDEADLGDGDAASRLADLDGQRLAVGQRVGVVLRVPSIRKTVPGSDPRAQRGRRAHARAVLRRPRPRRRRRCPGARRPRRTARRAGAATGSAACGACSVTRLPHSDGTVPRRKAPCARRAPAASRARSSGMSGASSFDAASRSGQRTPRAADLLERQAVVERHGGERLRGQHRRRVDLQRLVEQLARSGRAARCAAGAPRRAA